MRKRTSGKGRKRSVTGTGGNKKRSSSGAHWYSGNILVAMALKLMLVLFLLFLSRIVFFTLNFSYFSDLGFIGSVRLFFTGLRFDASALFIVNAPFIIMMILPFGFRQNRVYLGLAHVYFYLVNSIALMTNFIDSIYFRFTLKRLTADIFTYVGVGGDFDKLIPQFLRDFWFVAIIWVAFVWILIHFGRKFAPAPKKTGSDENAWIRFGFETLLFGMIAAVAVVAIRGGLQLRPIGLVTAGNYTSAKYIPLVINTPFSIAKTIGGERLALLTHFRNEKELSAIYSPVHPASKRTAKPLNLMIIIMESFSREHIGLLNRAYDRGRYQGYTPFLDSLIRQGLYFNAYANGKTSIQGIPAILSSIPSLMNESFIQSPYASGKYTSIAGLLRKKGYSSAFFHGGTNGTMGFDSYTKLVGFDRYYGRTEYNNEKDYDGKWGIRDEEFFQFTARMNMQLPQPFVTALFSLSSHHPYFVPSRYTNIFRRGQLPIQQSIMYSDHALARFFYTARQMPWYSNTLFVITADHTSEGHFPYYQSDVGQYAIPLLFFQPGSDLKGMSSAIAQQTDIMPTVLNYLGYDESYLAFGSDLFDSITPSPRFSIHYITGIYGLIKDQYYFEHDGHRTTSLFDLKSDLLQKRDLAGQKPDIQKDLELFLSAYLQQYNNRLIENRMMVEK